MAFQAVVLAGGRGSRVTDLVAVRPKCLLPIANKPMIWYSLKMLEKVGFREVIVVVQESFKDEVSSIPEKFKLNLKLDVVALPKTEDIGTADAIRHIHDKIHSDLLIVSSDLITDVALYRLTDLHMKHGASVTALFSPVASELGQAPVPGPKTKNRTERDLIGIDEKTSRLVFMASEADFEEQLSVRKSVLKLFPKITMHSQLLDAHLYIVKKWVCDFLRDSKTFSMLKGELIPHLVRKQFAKAPAAKYEADAGFQQSVVSVKTQEADILSYVPRDEMEQQLLDMSFWSDQGLSPAKPYLDQPIRCYAYVHTGGLCLRANTLASYCEANRQLLKQWSTLYPEETGANVLTKERERSVGADCLVGEESQISERCSVKHSVVGNFCKIEDKAKITNCIIMDHVTIKEGTSLQGSIVLDKATVNEKCDIKDCLVGNAQKVGPSLKVANELLVDADRMMEV